MPRILVPLAALLLVALVPPAAAEGEVCVADAPPCLEWESASQGPPECAAPMAEQGQALYVDAGTTPAGRVRTYAWHWCYDYGYRAARDVRVATTSYGGPLGTIAVGASWTQDGGAGWESCLVRVNVHTAPTGTLPHLTHPCPGNTPPPAPLPIVLP